MIKVLYVDDEPLNVQLFRFNFCKKYIVFTAESAFDALKILQNEPEINVVISDMRMPGMTGLEFIMKAKDDFPEIIYYILTGYSISSELGSAVKNGLIKRCFSKPLNIEEIEVSMNALLRID